MKYTRKMPEENQEKTFKIVSEGQHRFQITDIFSESDEKIVIKCEVVSDVDLGTTLLYNVSNDPANKFFWLTKIFLKAIGEPHTGEIVIDTDAWIGRRFTGKVVHAQGKGVSEGKTFANIREIIPSDEKQLTIPSKNNPGGATSPEQIAWEE
jgi:hypothetical protein